MSTNTTHAFSYDGLKCQGGCPCGKKYQSSRFARPGHRRHGSENTSRAMHQNQDFNQNMQCSITKITSGINHNASLHGKNAQRNFGFRLQCCASHS